MGTHPHSMSVEKARTKIIFCKSLGKSPTPVPPNKSQNQRPAKNKNVVGLPHEPRRNGRSISPGEHLPSTSSVRPPASGGAS